MKAQGERVMTRRYDLWLRLDAVRMRALMRGDMATFWSLRDRFAAFCHRRGYYY